jgi:hypothetical protein
VELSSGQQIALVTRVREECARVAATARQARIEERRIVPYAASLPVPRPVPTALVDDADEREIRAAYWLTLDAINFGSGWFPTLRKLPGLSGYATIAAGVRRRFDLRGPWTATELGAIGRFELARVLRQDPKHELIGLFADSLHDLGERLLSGFDGSFTALVDSAGGSAVQLVDTLARWPSFADSSRYDGRSVPFLKRAQIAAADLARSGAARFEDVAELTMFADNLVPHVLRLDGILTLDPELVARIEREELIEHGSPEEVEIRACAVHAVELIVAASPTPTTAVAVDQLLWHRGQGRMYKSRARHRSRSSAY